ncbi:uncharacterized protein TNCV_4736281 [Trichonephila clavipes]|nr:uncharacterized protein TNCV_4736281 [Trichonephila clavipes]
MYEGRFDRGTFRSENEYLSRHAKTIVIAWRLLIYQDITQPHYPLASDSAKRRTNDTIFWASVCQIIHVEIVFDEFEITNMTYNPKFESLELFSVIGGYMGMYLGVSIVAVYDFAELVIQAIHNFSKNTKRPRRRRRNGRTQNG